MEINILELLKSEFNDEIVGKLGGFIGEDSSKTKAALDSIFPAVLGGLAIKGSTSQGASEILNMITNGGFEAETLKELSNTFNGSDATKNLLNKGTVLLNGVFGERVSNVLDWICSSSGVEKSSASELLGLVVPAVLIFLGQEVMGPDLNASSLMDLLRGQAGFLDNMAPAGLASVLGLSSFSSLAKSDLKTTQKKGSSFWKWLLPLIILAAIIMFFFFRN